MVRRYLQKAEDEAVYLIYDQWENSTEFVGRVLVHTTGIVVYKGTDKMALSWDELEMMLKLRVP